MIVLGIDSSASTSSAAVVGPGGAAVFGSREPRAHARVLPGLLDDALAAAPGPVDLVAVSRGPGLFTGHGDFLLFFDFSLPLTFSFPCRAGVRTF